MVKLQFTSYHGSDLDYSGSCCDGSFFGCIGDCEVWFEFCITTFPVKWWHQCQVYATSFILGGKSFGFPAYGNTLGPRGVKNPLVWKHVDRWPVSVIIRRYILSANFSDTGSNFSASF